MGAIGLWMLPLLGLLIVFSGLPVWALLIGVASAFAAAGVATGAIDAPVLAALPARLVGLLEHDLLQAMPLYVFIGVLLQRLPLADALFSVLAHGAVRLTGRAAAGPPLAVLGVGALIAPMNGSVASSSALLARLAAGRLGATAPARATALIGVAATIGVVVPPSLVLILLGDAMLRAHTEAGQLAGAALRIERIVNTQDVLHAALLPAAAVLVLWLAVAWWQTRGGEVPDAPLRPPRRQTALALATAGGILALLAGVFSGRLFAVEAAATGGCLLVAGTLACRALDAAQWREVLAETLALSGALFALLIGATTFSLVFRVFGTDRWLTELLLGTSWPPLATAGAVLLGVALCAWVLDAFEMIFVVVPLVAPPLIVQLGDAQQAAVLLLLVLQMSFLVPPMGYAVLMARSRSGLPQVATGPLLRALLPYLAVQLLLVALVFALPQIVHGLDATADSPSDTPPATEQEIRQQMEEMARQAEPAASDEQAETDEKKSGENNNNNGKVPEPK